MNEKIRQKNNLNRGFTLVELLVTITMFVILTGVVLVNSNQFDNSVLLHNFSYDVVLTIKQAQSYGVSVRESSLGAFNTLPNQGYGVYFDLNQSNKNFVLFNDVAGSDGYGNPNQMYDGSITSCPVDSLECLQKYSMRNGTFVQKISVCTATNCIDASDLSILFYRPKLDANIFAHSSLDGSLITSPSYAQIILSSTNGMTSTVVVTSVGQIYIK